MNATADTLTPDLDPITRFRQAAAEDLRLLALLHDRELDRERLLALFRDCYEDFLALRLEAPRGREAIAQLRAGLTDIPANPDAATLDRLAAEYADIYLTNGYGASPCESVWLDEDGLTMQEPMFQIRAWYRRHGLAVKDWRKRTDDHLVNQLQFVAHLIDLDGETTTLEEAARFLDEHLLRWIDDFAERVAARCETQLYAGLAQLTAAYLDELRDLLAQILGSPRPGAEEIEERMRPKVAIPVAAPGPYVPGTGPTW
jgi:TorA maturation chaperone TorD